MVNLGFQVLLLFAVNLPSPKPRAKGLEGKVDSWWTFWIVFVYTAKKRTNVP